MANRGINKVILVGNLGRDPEIRYTQGGDPVANITVATSESWKDRNTGENRENTEWHRVVMFRGLAKVAEDWLKKGQQVYIEGRLQTRKWQDQSGQDRYTTEIVANDMQMLGGRGGGGGGGSDSYDQSPPPEFVSGWRLPPGEAAVASPRAPSMTLTTISPFEERHLRGACRPDSVPDC